MNGAVIYMWEGVEPGREAAARQLMQEASAFYDAAKADGRITDYAWYSSSMLGMNQLVVRGDLPDLMALESTPEAAVLNMKAMTVNQQFRWGYFATGELTEQMVGLWVEFAESLQ
jgi:hypothetical protein